MSEQNKQPIWKKILYQIRLIASRDDSALLSNPTFAKEWQRQNLVACLTISAMAALLGLIGLLGTFSPLSEETVLSWINATIAYSLILFINLSFFFMFGQMIQRFVTDGRTSVSTIMHFLRMEMLLASTTFFSTQTGSSFFFEYLLVSMAVYLVPLYRHSDLPGLVTLNLVPTALIILLIRPSTVWQDLVDLCIFHVFCLAMVFLRWYSFQQYESVHINLMSLNSELFGQSRRDRLTGLLNRAALRDDFPRFIGHPVCVALIDLDYFKQINDTYGHQFGDRILIFVSKTLKSVFSHPDDFCYRYGGDEMLVLSISNDPDGFQARLEELQRQCMYSDPTGFQTEMSIGTCSGAPADETSLRSFIRTADRKLYQEKNSIHQDIVHGSTPLESLLSSGQSDLQGVPAVQSGSKKAVPASASGVPSASDKVDAQKGSAKAVQTSPAGASSASDESGAQEDAGILPRKLSSLAELDSMNALEQEQEQLAGQDWKIVYFDISHFAETSDALGSRSGMQIRYTTASILRSAFSEDLLANSEIDHFILLTTADCEKLKQQIGQVQLSVASIHHDTVLFLSAGIYHHKSGEPEIDFVTAVLNAKYACRRAGSDSILQHLCVYDVSMDQARRKEAFVRSNFERALAQHQIVPYYQPVIGTLSGRTSGLEALARWIDPELGVIPPCDFIPYLEKMNVAYRLDLYLLEQVALSLQSFKGYTPCRMFININLSQTDFVVCDMPAEIDKILKRYGIPADRIQFEITETALSDRFVLLHAIKGLEQRGYQVWVDDFGTGQSSLNVLKDYYVRGIKLDQAFFHAASDQSRARIIIDKILELSHSIGCLVIAEGVETREQYEFARQAGINYIQGFYFSCPLPLTQLQERGYLDTPATVDSIRLYQPATIIDLYAPMEAALFVNNRKTPFFGKAVLECKDQKIVILRMSDPMKQLLGVAQESRLLPDSQLQALFLRVMHRADQQKAVYEFRLQIKGIFYLALISPLSSDSTNTARTYVLVITNYALNETENSLTEVQT